MKLENIKLLLMDEPVANLDIKSEKEISDILKNLEYSVLAVSHRNEVFNEYMKVYRMEKLCIIYQDRGAGIKSRFIEKSQFCEIS